MRRLHGSFGRQSGALLPSSHRLDRRPRDHDIEAIGETPVGAKVQKAWLDVEVVQCGYCQPGQIMSAAALLAVDASSRRFRYRRCDGGKHLPLRNLCAHSRRDQEGGGRRAG